MSRTSAWNSASFDSKYVENVPSATPARWVMPTIELSEKPRSPNSSRAASRILRSVRSPLGVRGALAAALASGCTASSTLTPIRLPYRGGAHSQVETRFNFQYDMFVTSDATVSVGGEKSDVRYFWTRRFVRHRCRRGAFHDSGNRPAKRYCQSRSRGQ